MNTFVYVISVNGLLFFISLVFYFIPPKKINKIYGYRTHRTMLNDSVWNFANNLFSQILLKYAGISFVLALLLTFLNPFLMNSWVPMGLMIFTLLICVVITEKALNENFDEEGNSKIRK